MKCEYRSYGRYDVKAVNGMSSLSGKAITEEKTEVSAPTNGGL